MLKLLDFKWLLPALGDYFTFYGGGGKGGSTSSSQPVDFFGKDKRAPYESLLHDLLLGGTIGGTAATTTGKGKNKVTIPGTPGVSIGDFIRSQPGFMFQYGQGLDALNRNFAARGVSSTGAQDIALQNYGNKYAGDYMQQLITNLMGPAGVSMGGQSSQSQSGGSSPFGTALGMYAGAGFPGMSGLFAGGAASTAAGGLMTSTIPALGGLAFSDKTLKRDIKFVDIIKGHKIYTYKYIWSNQEHKGVMAQDLLETHSDAITMNKNGYYMVDYSKLGV